ncbi:MAG: ribonuclease H-like domain-containing protein [Roseburia sp.]|nr:ribonuclease H-like domain-containing protein [Roseburia sp.]
MEIIHKTILLPNDCYTLQYFGDHTAFFDIETTGFSGKNCIIYLIGLVIRNGNTMEIYQYFANSFKEEAEILTAFHETIKTVSSLICYNGLNFDLPFLKQREEKLHLSFSWESISFLDLYQETRQLGNLLRLPDKKQKTLESFLGIHRGDTYTGGELISVYCQYEKQPTDFAKNLLLLHNYEDILGMTKLLPLLSYNSFFREEPVLEKACVEETLPFDAESPIKELQISLQASLPFPRQITLEKDVYRLVFRQNHVHLFVPVLEGELRFYYDNYRDYYYLPAEDIAVHKSVASFVDKSHRKKATPKTCYTRRVGLFLPQCSDWFTPCFYPGQKEKKSYFEYCEDFLSDPCSLGLYIKNILSLFI